jgi:hypothetical protein
MNSNQASAAAGASNAQATVMQLLVEQARLVDSLRLVQGVTV